MKEFRMRAFFGILGLAGAGFMISSVSSVGGCSSSSGGSTGTAGSNPTGTGGTTGNAGTTGNGGSGGSGGGGGASAAVGCATSELAPGDTSSAPYTIADFTSVDGGSIPIGGTFTYASPTGAVAPTATVTSGGWHITLTAPGMATAPQYVGVGIYFNGNAAGDACVDGTAHTGVKFDITGTIGGTGCTAQFSINDSEHSDAVANSTDKKAGGPAGAYAPQTTLTVGTTPTVMVPFTGPTGGSPATAVDKMKLTGVQWQFTVAAGATSMCTVDVVIDNVGFY